MSFKPKRIEEPQDDDLPARPSSAELSATIGPLTSRLIPTSPAGAPDPVPSPPLPAAEPVLMMSFKASRPFAKMLAEAGEKEGGLRRLIARVFHEAGWPVPPSELQPQRRRRTYD
jgi:hypothetical protein